MKNFLSFVWEVLKTAIIALIIVVPIRYFLFQPFIVRGQSMEPNFYQNDYLIIDEISYRLREPQRGEIVVFKYPRDPSQRYIKRVVALPGETIEIEDSKVIISSDPEEEIVLNETSYLGSVQTTGELRISLGENEYFVLGDNRPFSSDSRRWGVLPKENIVGRFFVRAWPFNSFLTFELPNY